MGRVLLIVVLLAGIIHTGHAQIFSVKGNVLSTLALSPEAGLECAVAPRWTMEAAVMVNPVRGRNFSMGFTSFSVNARWWKYKAFTGHFAGINALGGTFSMGRGSVEKGWYTALGASYGYAWMLSPRVNISLEGGIGIYYIHSLRRKRDSGEYDPECIHHLRKVMILPSRASVGISYLF